MQPPLHRILALAAGIALATALLTRSSPAAAAALTALATLAVPRRGWGLAGLAALPALLAALPGAPPNAPLPAAGPVRIAGTVVDVRRDVLTDATELLLDGSDGRVRLRCTPPLDALPGDHLRALARCTGPAVPDGTGTLHAFADACDLTAGTPSLPRACTALRLALDERLRRWLPRDDALLVSALVLGAGTRVPNDLAAAHRATGLSHLLAVSGAHAALLAMLLGLQPFGGGKRRRVGTAHLAAALLLLLVYGAITGFEPPVFRALVSYALAAFGSRAGRRLGAIAGLAWPALLSCVLAPRGVLGASFCLSYAAVAGLWLAGAPRHDGRVERWLLAPIRASFWATTLTAPLTLGWFGQLAPWTVLLTPMLAPLVAALLGLGLCTAVLALLVPWSGALLAPPLAWLAETYANAVQLADELPATPVHALWSPPWPVLLLAALIGVAAFACVRGRGGALLGCALASLPHFLPAPAPGDACLRLLAVGHGQCCAVTFADGSNVVVDCGSLQHPVLPARRLERVLARRTIDLLVLTHQDRDHTDTVLELVRRLPVRRAILPASMRGHPVAEALRLQRCALTWLAPGERDRSHPQVEVAAPTPDAAGASTNDRSLWTTFDLDGTRVLLPGDAEQAGIAAAIARGIAAPADVLVLPHHGRADPAVDALLAVVRPRLCLCSNRTGEGISAQGRAVLARGVPTFATGDCGDLELHGGAEPRLTAPGGLPLPPPAAR